jgi:hypothetical protein
MDVCEVPCSSCSDLDRAFLMDVGPTRPLVSCSAAQLIRVRLSARKSLNPVAFLPSFILTLGVLEIVLFIGFPIESVGPTGTAHEGLGELARERDAGVT